MSDVVTQKCAAWWPGVLQSSSPPPEASGKLRFRLATTQPNRNRLADDVSYSLLADGFWHRAAITAGRKSRLYLIDGGDGSSVVGKSRCCSCSAQRARLIA